jgi:tetratricopeptide (TPR) repeat protein
MSEPSRTTMDEITTAAPASVSEAEFDSAARQTYREAFLALAQHPEARVRLAVAQMAQPDARDAAVQTMWQYAQNNPDDPLTDEIYLLCGAVGERTDNPLGQRALEISASLSQDPDVWQMLSRSYRRMNRASEAQAAALVSEGVEAQTAGRSEEAQTRLEQALPNLTAPALRAPVESRLGEIAEQRGEWDVASTRFAQAFELREQTAAQQPAIASEAVIQADAQQLVRALDRAGRTQEACNTLREAQAEHDVATPDQALLERCRQLRVQVQPRVELAPRLREQRTMQRAPIQQTAPEQRTAPTP